MSHKKAQIMQVGPVGNIQGPSEALMGHSESNPLLAPPVINDRVKLERLNHIPSVKSNLILNDNMSQGTLDPMGASVGKSGLNYENMPVGKKSILVPIQVMNSQMADNSHPVLSKIENNSQVINRKNNRTLKPL